ncbi:MAG: hypothetical protein JWR83_3425 [Aeromicrobium sp.]|nr:hypothetical protein [Aeromicrobium sp.]
MVPPSLDEELLDEPLTPLDEELPDDELLDELLDEPVESEESVEVVPVVESVVVDVVPDESAAWAAPAARPPASTTPAAANAAKCRREAAVSASREVELFIPPQSSTPHHGHLSPRSNAGQMSL